MQQPEEALLVASMLEELRSKLAVNLDPSPSFERGLGGQVRPKQARDFLVIGSSNASKLSAALAQQGFSSCVVFQNNLRLHPQSVEEITPRVLEAIQEMDPSVVVFYCLDNSIFYSRTSDGSRTAPRRGEDGLFHIEGEVTIASSDVCREHMAALKPLLQMVGKKRGIIISPLPRYIVSGCCSDPQHCSNRRLLDFEQQQKQSLEYLKKTIKDYLFTNGLRFIRVLDPMVDVRGMEADAVWGTDPVHPTEAVYSKIAAATAKLGDKLRAAEAEAKRRRDSIDERVTSGHHARRGRGHPPHGSENSQSWRGGRGRAHGGHRGSGGGGREEY
jgi:hypothetical protein